MEKHFVLALAILLCRFALSSATAGTASYSTSSPTPSACYGYQEMGTMTAAASDVIWNNGGACGRTYRVACTGPINEGEAQPCKGNSTVIVKIVDYCPSGCPATFDLSQEAFSAIADLSAGKIRIDYEQV